MRESPDDQTNGIFAGIAMTFLMNVVWMVVGLWFGSLFRDPVGMAIIVFVLALGVSQLVYIGPAVLIARRRGRHGVAKGLIIGAAITLILSGACWAIINPFTPLNIH